MTISRLLILQGLLAAGLGTLFVIPRQSVLQPCRVRMDLPEYLGSWHGEEAAVSDKEKEGLAEDTRFCRKMYDDGFGDKVYVSIVLSGQELDNSIHRPERCLPSQGYSVMDSRKVALPVPSAPGGVLPLTRLHNSRQQIVGNGEVINVYNLSYYFFIGYSDLTADHFQREFIDLKDRLLHGYNQRWAYVTVASNITSNLAQYGKNEEQTDDMLKKIIERIFPLIVKDEAQLKAEAKAAPENMADEPPKGDRG